MAPEFLVEVDAAAEGLGTLADARGYLEAEGEAIRAEVARGKAYWFRGFPARELREFHDLITRLDPRLLPYAGAKVQNAEEAEVRLYSPTSTPRYRKNFLHNEVAYQRDVPGRLAIFCQRQAPEGGESILGDQRAVARSIPLNIRERLRGRGLRFQRFLRNETWLQAFLTRRFDVFAIMPSWQGNLGTRDRRQAEERCRAEGFECTWTRDGGLLLTCPYQPFRPHPETGEEMWVCNAHLFQLHRRVYGPFLCLLFRLYFFLTGAPRTTCTYADGAPLEPEVVDAILDATEANEVALPLAPGDFVYAHNRAVGHGRRVFCGPRKLYFGIFS